MPQPHDLSRLYQLAQSPAGQQLLTLLQETGGQELHTAMAQAKNGDPEKAREQLSALLRSPEAKRLLDQLGGSL